MKKELNYLISPGLWVLVIFFLARCSGEKYPSAKKVHYYLELTDNSSDQYAKPFFTEIESAIQNKQYAITKSSEGTWPFYSTYSKKHLIPLDSLTPPHVISHYFPSKEPSHSENGDFLVKVVFLDQTDNLWNFDLILFKRLDGNWIETVNTGNHKITPKRLKYGDSEANIARKIIIRYSFK